MIGIEDDPEIMLGRFQPKSVMAQTSGRESEGSMIQAGTDLVMVDQLILIARDPELRQAVYERLGEYCHQCRNRLNSLKLSIYLAMKQSSTSNGLWEKIDGHYRDLEARVEQIQFLCRPIHLSRVTLGLDLLIDDRRASWVRLMESGGGTLEFIPPAEPAVASFDVERLGHALDTLVAWRAEVPFFERSVRLRWWSEAGYAHLVWEEPGSPSIEGEDSPDVRGTTWTLPMLARVILAHGGDYQIETDRGWRLEVAWPSAPVMP